MLKNLLFLISLLLGIGCNDQTETLQFPEADVPAQGREDSPPTLQTPIHSEDNIGPKKLIIKNHTNNKGDPKDSSGYEQEGEWLESKLQGHQKTASRYTSDPRARVSYSSDKLGGRYCVSIFRVTHPNSTSKAEYSLKHQGLELYRGRVNLALDESFQGWIHIGAFTFHKGDLVKLTLQYAKNNPKGYLRADDVRFKRLKAQNDCHGAIYKLIRKEGIIDNSLDANSQSSKKDDNGYRQFGLWKQSRIRGHKESISRYSSDPQAYVTYTARVKHADLYCVSLYRITHPNSTQKARIHIRQVDLEDHLSLNYAFPESNKGWVSLGEYYFETEQDIIVKIFQTSSKAFLRADAVRFKQGNCN